MISLWWKAAFPAAAGVLLTSWAVFSSDLKGEPAAYLGAAMVGIAVPLSFFKAFRMIAKELDWRVTAILVPAYLAVIITFFIYAVHYWRDPSTFWGSVFASWVASVIFFALLGIVGTIISLARPETEAFETRARILFRRESGQHIDYIVSRIREIFEHYSESVKIKIRVTDYDVNEKKYRIAIDNTIVVRSYIDDIESKFSSEVKFSGITAPPPGKLDNRLTYLRINGEGQTLKGLTAAGNIDEPFTKTISRGGHCEIDFSFETWVNEDSEPITYETIRYSQVVSAELENNLSGNRVLKIKTSLDRGKTWDADLLRTGARTFICVRKDIPPDIEIYDIRLLPP
jgi:hypothetical protein